MLEQCMCGHSREEHLMITTKGCILCSCELFQQMTAFTINTAMNNEGLTVVTIAYGSSTLHLTADAAVQVALNILSAAYAARGQQAIYSYSKAKGINYEELNLR